VLEKHLEDIENFTSHMGDTIENFRTYFHPDKPQTYFNVSKTIEKAKYLLNLNYNNDKIRLNVNSSNDIRIHTYEDELIQVLIVLLMNAKEALEYSKTEEPFINIIVKDRVSSVDISVIDNAGGIDDSTIKQIFNPYFTTKHDSDNSGIGLYMAKMIVEGSMHGKLDYKRIGNESHFCIILEGLK
jgi:C4-dicarboxylate-specific signal transduction histidine kinase